MNDKHLTPPISFVPDERGLPRADYLVASRLGSRGLVRFRMKQRAMLDDAARHDALVILTSSADAAWMRLGGKLMRVPASFAAGMMARLTVGDAVLRSVLGPRKPGGAMPEDAGASRVVTINHRLSFRTMRGFVPARAAKWPADLSSTRYVVLVPHGRVGQSGVSCSDAPCMDALPGLADANAVVDNRGDRSLIRYRGRLQPCPRNHARWMLLALAEHSNLLESMHGLLHAELDLGPVDLDAADE
jgi:hypothetical protein